MVLFAAAPRNADSFPSMDCDALRCHYLTASQDKRYLPLFIPSSCLLRVNATMLLSSLLTNEVQMAKWRNNGAHLAGGPLSHANDDVEAIDIKGLAPGNLH